MSEKEIKTDKLSTPLSRREFLGKTAASAAGLMVVPRHVIGGQKDKKKKAPSDTLNIGCVGVGGKGFSDVQSVSSENIVALCDVDATMMEKFLTSDQHLPEHKAKYEKAHIYRDFREMLDREKSLDAITVSTPDHTHAVVAMMAMKMGKHVFVQKPLTHTVKEARLLRQEAEKRNLVTQMGNQGHSKEGARLVCEWIWDGAIGPVREVHVWTNRPIWPQAIDAPKEIPSCPPTLSWDLWLGPAPWRPYHPAYCPFVWRGWWDFGTGALGDMGAHLIDQPFWALKLGAPVRIQASSTKFTKDSYPLAEIVTYEFPEREGMPPVKLIWYDGGLMPPRPKELPKGRRLGDEGGGCLFVGDKGMLVCSTYGENPRLLPDELMRDYKRPEKTIPRSPGIHEEWIAAIKEGKKSTTDFSYSGPLTEMMLLGNIALRFKDDNVVLEWDSQNFQFTNLPEANEYLHKVYRSGWEL
ncbi:MAG: Gfo/Idh/MocA family oxidoreductase [Candidatus Saccharicenans sp.]|jgi:predicted dehydrogenase|nr:Gfo/Idh/MocA family oxidoreductase [Candidatus Saccharicenans sp.]MDH7576108.1 Gfo/Idh/MocA family oxidoreductase [Candidatus Saccharicenans sp.]